MSKALFITKIFNLKIRETIETPIELMPHLYLTNDRKFVKGILNTRMKQAIGAIEADALIDADTVIYGVLPANFAPDLSDDKLLLCNLLFAYSILRTSWLIRDNCSNIELAFLGRTYRDINGVVSSNFLKFQSSLADCNVQSVEFTVSDFTKIVVMHASIYGREKTVNASG